MKKECKQIETHLNVQLLILVHHPWPSGEAVYHRLRSCKGVRASKANDIIELQISIPYLLSQDVRGDPKETGSLQRDLPKDPGASN